MFGFVNEAPFHLQIRIDEPPIGPRKPGRPRFDSIERVMAQAGDAWTILILREAFFGVRRFDAFQRNLGVSPNILTDRLQGPGPVHRHEIKV